MGASNMPLDSRINLAGSIGWIFRPFPWLILLGWVLAIQARAEDPATLRVGTEIGFQPYVDVDAQGRSTGFAVELFTSVAQASGLKAEYFPQPWSSAWTGLQRGEVDALPLVARLPMREGLVEFTKPHTIGYDTFFTRNGQAAINTIEDARQLNIIVLRADAAHDVLVKQGFDRQLMPVDTLAQGFRLLASGQFDALLAPVVQGRMQVHMLGLDAAIEHGPMLREYRREFCFAVAKGNTQLRDRLERGLESAKVSGEYDRLYRKWLGIYEPKTFPRIYVFWAVAGLIAMVALLLLWSWTLRRQVEARTRELRQQQAQLEERVAERTSELSASEIKYRLLVEQSPDGIFVADQTGHYIDVNSTGAAMLGYSREELLSFSIPDVLVEEEHARLPAAIASYADGSVITSEWTFRRKDGSTFLGELVGRQFPDGRLKGILRDITERKQAEAEIQAQRDLLDVVFQHMPAAVNLIRGRDLRLLMANPAYRALAPGKTEFVGKTLDEIWPETGRDFEALCRRVLDTGEPHHAVDDRVTIQRQPGGPLEEAYFTWSLYRVRLPGDEGWGIFNPAWETTARKKAEAELAAAHRQTQDLIDNATAMIYVCDLEERFVLVNAALAALLETTPSQMIGRRRHEFMPQADADAHEAADHKVIASGQAVELEERSDLPGRSITWLSTKFPLRDEQGRICAVAGIVTDITERKQAEAAQQRMVSILQATLESTADGLLVVDLEGRITGYNQQFTRLWRIPEAILSTRDDSQVLAFVLDQFNDPEAFLSKVRQLYATPQVSDDELEFKDGRIFERYSQPQWLEGRPVGRVWSFRDVTANRRATQALREADKRKDEFLAMLAHELRNPLAPIRNAAYVLGRLNLDEPRVRWAQAIIERQVTHLTRLVDELLDVSRIARGKITLHRAPIMLADLLRQAGESVQPVMAEKRHQFEMQLPAESVLLEGDIVRLVQVLQNLLNNAAKFTPVGGHIQLEARQTGEEIEIEVRDNGAGISADLLPGVFDLFRQGERTLDRSQGGLGIGLTLVQRLVEMHSGRVEAHSDGAGLGARFTVRLPVSRLAPADLPATGEPAAMPSGLKVLVVDDESSVLESMVMLLELEGHQVRSAASGTTALQVLEEFWPQIVLLDIGLPEQDGYEVARQLRRLPGGEQLILVAVSGYGHQEALSDSQQAGFDTHLIKPVDPNKLNLLLNKLGNQQ
jgi:PAS domain S-box-containing protein